MAIDWNKVIEQALATATVVLPVVVPAVIGGMIKLRKLEQNQQTLEQNQQTALKNQDRIETKADGNHTRALEAVKETSRENVEQLIRAVEKVLNAQSTQSKQRGRRRTDPP